jgi:hypothetical protein
MTLNKIVLAIAIVTNLFTYAAWRNARIEYQDLLTWACEHGNGGHECGEN